VPYGSGAYGSGTYGFSGAGTLITAVNEIEWRDTLFGWPATNLGITDCSGWLDYSLRGGNLERPGRHGTFAGQTYAEERVIEVELTAIEDDPALLIALRRATVPDEDPIEEPFAMWMGTDQPQVVMAKLKRRSIPTDHAFSIGHHRATLQFVASDPKRYAVTESTSPMVGLPTPGIGGLTFPLTFPLAFGTPGTPGSTTVTNTGEVPTWPVYTLTGPITGPVITTGGAKLRFATDFELALGQTAVIDTDTRSILINGVARPDLLIQREWAYLPPDVPTVVAFTGQGVYDPAAGLVVSWRSAWI
jgi:hypothetical protein